MKQVWMYAAFLAVVMSGCSSSEEGDLQTSEIRVGATVSGAITKAPVVTGDTFTAAITAFEGTQAPASWTAAFAWQNSITLIAAETAAGTSVPLNVSKVYPATGNVYMAAWHPEIASVSGVVTFQQTGTEDVMYGGIVSGSKSVPAGAFSFTHALTQLNFQVQASDGYLTANPDKKITKIEVLSASYPKTMTIVDGIVTYATAATLPVPGITSTQLTKDVTKIGEPFMIQALNGVKVKVTYEGGTTSPDISIMDASTKEGLNALAGNSHLITLSFLKTGEIAIEGTATVAPWQVGASGNGTVTE
ncbi:fimbrillin family protein [Parabacteroides gordonii]|jgi:hypothetical protein|uniref:Fimbrillin family protein n=1 Tax=Parabacteroides gordonii MS-1 = DSM 23371 TaxID=1203610 RepID=A0A0F5IV26_9BACT|nr:fimbrillin family protein [Parabacteroides gordonii]KKB49383.1 hypothetical protein HMPREF1536_04447 [Parabacteroides gordonii MS-1 = DSM 23371]MCA5585654.1 fimbrillin family protein [Parabacteroides gordonii]RGP16942.1 hypothetical protein DXB27_09515 [Parabacteroides gordonii]